MSYTTENGDRFIMNDNGMVDITPKGESTRSYTVQEIIDVIVDRYSKNGSQAL